MCPEKKNYIKNMRFDVCEEKDIIDRQTGALNLKYFNTKRFAYWSVRETELLMKLLLKYDATAYKKI